MTRHQSPIAWVLGLLLVARACSGAEVRSKYVAYKNGEPVHVADPAMQPPATCNKICLHFGQLTKDCDCECDGLWKGKVCEACSLRPTDCLHGSVLDASKCHCVKCPYPFAGELCDVCQKHDSDCKNGGLIDARTCTCTDCKRPWGGKHCDVCQLPKGHCGAGGALNEASCSCKCPSNNTPKPVSGKDADGHVDWHSAFGADGSSSEDAELTKETTHVAQQSDKSSNWMSWADAFSFLEKAPATAAAKYCGECPITAADCADGSTFDGEACMCSGCPAGRGGPDCSKCHLAPSDCLHGSVLDAEACKCSNNCPPKWKGQLCDTCALSRRDCENGGRVNKRLCRCEKCAFPWGGDKCNACELQQTDCQHGGRVCKSKCKCYQCTKPWKGQRCNVCGLNDDDCMHGGVADTTNGQCKCKCSAGGKNSVSVWTGPRCEVCGLAPEACGDGTVLDKDACICKGNAEGIAESARLSVEKASKDYMNAIKEARNEKSFTENALKAARAVSDANGKKMQKLLEGTLKAKTEQEASLLNGLKASREADQELTSPSRRRSAVAFIEESDTKPAPEVAANGFQKHVPPPRSPEGELIRCRWTGQPDLLSTYVGGKEYYGRRRTPNYFQHLFVATECDGGYLPDPRKGDWLSSIRSTYHCGISQQWSVLSPNEMDGPGIMWYNDAPCNGENMGMATVEIDFFLPKPENAKYLHICRFQGHPERVVKTLPCAEKDVQGKNYSIGCQKQNSYYQDLINRIPGRMDRATDDNNPAGVTKSFQQTGDARFWMDKEDVKHFDSQFSLGGHMAPGFYQHVFKKEECTNGLPPTMDDRKCLVSFRWGEHCGGDWDWSAKQGKATSANPRLNDPSKVSWYTSQECKVARVAVDFYCPPNDKDLLNTFQRRLHTCKFRGDGKKADGCPAAANRHANNAADGQCLEHVYSDDDCGDNGLPGKDKVDKAPEKCLVALNGAVQCGNDQDFAVKLEGHDSTKVQWYQEGWSLHRDGNGKACSKANVDVQFLCINECTRRCKNGAKLDGTKCECRCPGKWTGVECQLCGLQEQDCRNDFQLDFKNCKCEPKPDDRVGKKRWTGVLGGTCKLKQSDCKNGGVLNTKSCACEECRAPWAGMFCEDCTRSNKECKRGSTVDPGTCKCSIGCKAPFWGDRCERCPRGIPGDESGLPRTNALECSGAGTCNKDTMQCECANGYTGKSCQFKPKMGVCSLQTFSELVPIAKNGAKAPAKPLELDGQGQYVLLRGPGVDAKSEESVNVVRDHMGFVGISVAWTVTDPVTKVKTKETLNVVGKKGKAAGGRPSISFNCKPKNVASSFETPLGGVIENEGGNIFSVASPSGGIKLKITIFSFGQQQYLNAALSARLVGGKGSCRATKGTDLNSFIVRDKAQSTFCDNTDIGHGFRFRQLVSQKASASLRSTAKASISWGEQLDKSSLNKEIDGIGRFASIMLPGQCQVQENDVRRCCSRISDGQEFKAQNTKVPNALEKIAYKACVKTICKKSSCSMAITMGRMPANLKFLAKSEAIEDKRRRVDELKQFSREGIRNLILEKDDDPDRC